MTKHAVVIGINQYDGFSPLAGAEHDARAFEAWLRDPAGGAFDTNAGDTLEVLLSSRVGGRHAPWRDHIDQAFVPFVTGVLAPGAQRKERLYVFLAGHGFSDPNSSDSAALYAANANFYFSPHVAGPLYADWFRRNGAFDEIVLVMDCCRSVSALTQALPPHFPVTSNPLGGPPVRIFYAFATQWAYDTREKDIGGTTRGLFSTALLDGLRNAPADAAGAVTGSGLKDYIHNRLSELAAGTPFVQPDIRADKHADVVFARRGGAPTFTVNVTVAPPADGAALTVTRGGTSKVESQPIAPPVNRFLLTPGVYKIEIAGTTRSQLFEVVGRDVSLSL